MCQSAHLILINRPWEQYNMADAVVLANLTNNTSMDHQDRHKETAPSPATINISTSGGRIRRQRRRRNRGQNSASSADGTDTRTAAAGGAGGGGRDDRFDGCKLRNLLRSHHNSSTQHDQVREARWKKSKSLFLSPSSSSVDPSMSRSSSSSSSSPTGISDPLVVSSNEQISYPKDSLLDVVLKTSPPDWYRASGGSAFAPAALSQSSARASSIAIIMPANQSCLDTVDTAPKVMAKAMPSIKAKPSPPPPLSHQADPSSLAASAELSRRYAPKVTTATATNVTNAQRNLGGYGLDPNLLGFCTMSETATSNTDGRMDLFASPLSATGTKADENQELIDGNTLLDNDKEGDDEEDQLIAIENPSQQDMEDSVGNDTTGRIKSLSNLLRNSFALRRKGQQEEKPLTGKVDLVVVTTTPDTVDDNEEFSMELLSIPQQNEGSAAGGGGPTCSEVLLRRNDIDIEIDKDAFTRGADFILQLGHLLGKARPVTTPLQNRSRPRAQQQGVESVEEQDDHSTTSSLSSIAPRVFVPLRNNDSLCTVTRSVPPARRPAPIFCLAFFLLLSSIGFFMVGSDTLVALGTIIARKGINRIGGAVRGHIKATQSQYIRKDNDMESNPSMIESSAEGKVSQTSGLNDLICNEEEEKEKEDSFGVGGADDDQELKSLNSEQFNTEEGPTVGGFLVGENVEADVDNYEEEEDEHELCINSYEYDFAAAIDKTDTGNEHGSEPDTVPARVQNKLYEEYFSLQRILDAIYALSAIKARAIMPVHAKQRKPRPPHALLHKEYYSLQRVLDGIYALSSIKARGILPVNAEQRKARPPRAPASFVHQKVFWKTPFVPPLNASLGLSIGGGIASSRAVVPVKDALVAAIRAETPRRTYRPSPCFLADLGPTTKYGPTPDKFSELHCQGLNINTYRRPRSDDSNLAMFDMPLSQFLGDIIDDYRIQKKQRKMMQLESGGSRATGEAKARNPLQRLSDWLKQSLPLNRHSRNQK